VCKQQSQFRVSSAKLPSGRLTAGVNDPCHQPFSGTVPPYNLGIIPIPQLVPIFWGHFYTTAPIGPTAVSSAQQLLSDIVEGPYMNNLAQYGVGRGSVLSSAIIDDSSPPGSANENDIVAKLKKWLDDGQVKPKPKDGENSLTYFVFPPPTTNLTLSNGTTGFCGYHEHTKYNAGLFSNDNLFWATVATQGAPQQTGSDTIGAISYCVSHELTEMFTDSDGNGYHLSNGCELGDLCEADSDFSYRGWTVEQYYSNWDSGCIRGDNPVSVRRYLTSAGFPKGHGLRSYFTSEISIQVIARIRSLSVG
jgi:hypothetical protein